jgi:hypothetical protein
MVAKAFRYWESTRPLRRIGRRDLTPSYDGFTLKPVVDDTIFLMGERPEVAGCVRSRTAAS